MRRSVRVGTVCDNNADKGGLERENGNEKLRERKKEREEARE